MSSTSQYLLMLLSVATASQPRRSLQTSCPSGVLDSHWILAANDKSCTDACAAEGRVCLSDASMPTTEACIDEVSNLPAINRPCASHQPGAGSVSPAIYNGGGVSTDTCYYYTRTDPLNCSYSFASDWFQRLCPCSQHSPPPMPPLIPPLPPAADADATANPPSPPPPSTPPPSPPPPLPPQSNLLCIDGYWPLFTTELESNSNSLNVDGTSHYHDLNGARYWMPSGYPGALHGGVLCPADSLTISPPSTPPPSTPPPSPSLSSFPPPSAPLQPESIWLNVGLTAIGFVVAIFTFGLTLLEHCGGCCNNHPKWVAADCEEQPDQDDDPEAFARWKRRCEEREKREKRAPPGMQALNLPR